ncbi:MAG: Zn-dependent hydrolase [Hyphomicrobiales bacterium]|nr:MAG: Zn-dependent hydrolase [Hyphomicrobiales bacterium]
MKNLIETNNSPSLSSIATKIFKDVAAFSQDTDGISRPAFSKIETQTLEYLQSLCQEFGLTVKYDAGKNATISLPQHADATNFSLIGSHVDSVPMGGNFDGLAGVVAGILCLIQAKQKNIPFTHPVKVIALRGEESAWFGPCYIGSKCLLGVISDEELASKHKDDGQTLDTHMSNIGIDMTPIRNHQPLINTSSIIEFIELHIEQGPLLEEQNLPAAIVSAIRGNFRYKNIRCQGEAGHSGAVPKEYRKDPVMALADLLSNLDKKWQQILDNDDDLVLTSGVLTTNPEKHALSRIPDEVNFSLDIRSQNPKILSEMHQFLKTQIKKLEITRKVKFTLNQVNSNPPVKMNKKIVTGLSKAMKANQLKPITFASGGGHDSAVFAGKNIPTGMIFIRNQNGSHNPQEAMKINDLLVGTSIIFTYLTA